MKVLSTLALALASPCLLADDHMSLDGEFGFIATTGNTETTSAKGRLSASQELSQWSNDYILEGYYATDQAIDSQGNEFTKTTAQKFFASAQGNYKLTNPNHRIFVYGSYEDDRFSNFKYQSTLAAGWNEKLWDNETSKFSYSVGPGYRFAKTQTDESVNGLILRGALDYVWKFTKTATFKQALSTEAGSDNTRSKSESSVSAKLSEAFSMKVAVVLNHNTQVAPGVDKLDTETSVTLVYSFF